jgi:hypothetical protein
VALISLWTCCCPLMRVLIITSPLPCVPSTCRFVAATAVERARRCLTIRVVEGVNLYSADFFKKQDPCVSPALSLHAPRASLGVMCCAPVMEPPFTVLVFDYPPPPLSSRVLMSACAARTLAGCRYVRVTLRDSMGNLFGSARTKTLWRGGTHPKWTEKHVSGRGSPCLCLCWCVCVFVFVLVRLFVHVCRRCHRAWVFGAGVHD